MKKNIQLIILILFIVILLPINIMAESVGISVPANTLLTNQKINSSEAIINSTYYYSSALSRDEIVEFYKKLFISQDMYELPSFGNSFLFQKIPLRTASLNFTASTNKEKTEFFVNIIEMKKLPILPSNNFKSPQPLDFMPAYSSATQFLYYNSPSSPFTGVGYLTRSDPEEAKSFVSMIRSFPRDYTILLIDHDMDVTFEIAEKVMVLHFGKVLAFGSPEEVKGNSQVQEIYMGKEDEPS